jgi:hypothetical protein
LLDYDRDSHGALKDLLPKGKDALLALVRIQCGKFWVLLVLFLVVILFDVLVVIKVIFRLLSADQRKYFSFA